MLHELLLALYGTSGAIFRENDVGEMQIVKDLPFVHPSEREQLEEICKLGSFYKKLMNFIVKCSVDLTPVAKYSSTDVEEYSNRNGIYIQAFATGLDMILQPYRQILIKLEEQVLQDPHIPLSSIQNSLESKTQISLYHFLFPTLCEMIEKIERKKTHGCQVLDVVRESSLCGIPDVKVAMEKILHVCHSVLYKQLSAWMLHGLLFDDYGEFFISNRPPKTQTEVAVADDETQNQPQSEVIIRGITGRELDKMKDGDQVVNTVEVSTASLVAEMLPMYMSSQLAEKILFIGQSVKMFKDTGNDNSKDLFANDDILQGREMEFQNALQSLERQPQFTVSKLEVVIDNIKSCVAEQLWKLVVEEGELLKHLKFIKEIYLLGRGELFQTFIDRSQTILKAPPSNAVSYDLNAAFQRSLREILLDSEDYRAFKMGLEISDSSKEKNRQGDEITGWDSIYVSYEAPWPLHLFFTETIIRRYNNIFRFLFQVKRTQLDLQSLWAFQTVGKRSKDTPELRTSTTWGLRRQMAFLIDNLQYYLQVDVLEAQFSELMNKIKTTRDFESIQLAHSNFLTKLHAQSFITMKPVFNTLGEVLKTCRLLSDLLVHSNGKWSTREQTRTEELQRAFEQHSSLLLKILSTVRSHQVSPHLAQFLLRIDFNRFFTTNSGTRLLASV